MTVIRFDVVGVPAPQGSKTMMPNRVMVEGGSKTGRAKHKAWRQSVADAAREVAPPVPLDGPLRVEVTFRFPMPKSRPARARAAGVWPHVVKPDKDKCLRATLDALKEGGVIADDARVYSFAVDAFEVVGWLGAEIEVMEQEWS